MLPLSVIVSFIVSLVVVLLGVSLDVGKVPEVAEDVVVSVVTVSRRLIVAVGSQIVILVIECSSFQYVKVPRAQNAVLLFNRSISIINSISVNISFWNYLGPGLLFDLLCGVAPGGGFRSGAGLGIVLLAVVVVGVALEAREVRWCWGAAVEEICIKFWIVPKPDRSSTSAGLSLRPPRTLTSVETRSCGLSLVIKRHLISLSLPSDLLRIPAHPKAADVGEVDFIEEAEVILRNVIKSCFMEVLQVSSWWLLLTRPGSLPLGSDWSGLELYREGPESVLTGSWWSLLVTKY